MYSVYVSRQTDSARQITELHFHALEIFKTKVLLLLFYIAYARSSTAAGIQASIFRFWWKGKDLTLQKSFFSVSLSPPRSLVQHLSHQQGHSEGMGLKAPPSQDSPCLILHPRCL